MAITLTPDEQTMLCRWAGVLSTDTAAVAVLNSCYERALKFYTDAGCDTTFDQVKSYARDLACFYYDNRGRECALPNYIVVSVHELRGEVSPEVT